MTGTGDATASDVQPRITELLPKVGEVFGDYEILEERGRGGMGAVYKAHSRALGRIVALKVLLPLRRDSPRAEERFLREARSLAQVDHHNIVAIYHVGVHASLQFIEMQYVDGESLGERLRRGVLDVGEALRIVEQVAHALSHAHRRGIVHRDIKPGNILLTGEGVVKVVDFGLARAVTFTTGDDTGDTSSTMTVCGTPHYMAPEQWSGQTPDARTDQYCLGATFFHLVTGRPPFAGPVDAQMRQHLFEDPPRADQLNAWIPEGVSRLIGRLMEKDPGRRYASCSELVGDLRRLQHPGDEPSPRSTPEDRSSRAAEEPAPVALAPADHRRGSLVIGALAAATALLLHATGALEALERRGLDAGFAWSRGTAGESPVVIVSTDHESKERLAPDGPLSRERHYGELIALLSGGGARAIGMDLLFADRASSEEDGGLAAVTGRTSSVVHAFSLTSDPPRSAFSPFLEAWALDIPPDDLPEARRADLPTSEIAASTARGGHLALAVDPDGVIRRVPHLLVYRGRVYPSLSLAVAMTALGVTRTGCASPGTRSNCAPPRDNPCGSPWTRRARCS